MRQLCRLHSERKLWTAMIKRAMKSDLGWSRSAASYAELYDRLLAR